MRLPSMQVVSSVRRARLQTSRWDRGMVALAMVAGMWAISAAIAPAHARDVYFSIGVNTPGVSVGVSNAPVVQYHPPAVVHYPPPVVHYPPPVVHYPQPVVVQPPTVVYPRPVLVYQQPPALIGRPVVVHPQPVYLERPRHPGHRHGHHKGERHRKHQGPYYQY